MTTYTHRKFSWTPPSKRRHWRRKGAVLRPVIQAMQQHQPTTEEHENQDQNNASRS